jgi:putative transcription factor
MCGSENRLYKAELEGSVLNVCKHCSKYGKIVGNVHDKRFIEKRHKRREKEKQSRGPISDSQLIEAIVEDFAKIIKEKRESLDLKQEDFAKKINEKTSIIHKLETGHFEPSIKLARKIEKFLRVTLVEQTTGKADPIEKTRSDSFTLGDFIKVRK